MAAEAQIEFSNGDPIVDLIRRERFREATAECARLHAAGIGRMCMAMLSVQGEAEEAAQETLLSAFRGMSSYRGEGSVRAWLFGIARRICARRLETRGRRERRLQLVHDAEGDVELPDDLLEKRRRAHFIRVALEELKPSEREAVLMRYEAGLSYGEIAVACNIEEAAARKRTSRALVKLRKVMTKNEEAQ